MNISFLDVYKPLFEKKRYKCFCGGRGSGKSFHICVYLTFVASRTKVKILCVRQFMNSISESSKSQIEEIIELSGTYDHWIITNTEIIHKTTGSRFIFRAAERNVGSIKSINDVDIMFWEEADSATQESLDTILPTIRKEGSQCIFAWNPKSRSQPINQMFLENSHPDALVVHTTYLDNPYISSTFVDEANHMKATNPMLYKHIYMGDYLDVADLHMVTSIRTGVAQSYPNDGVYFGVDIARSGGDATCICVRKGRNILKMRELHNVDIDKLVPELQGLINQYKPCQINIDSTGHGAWVSDALKSNGIIVKEINFASSAHADTRYANMRTELYGLADKFFADGGVIPANDQHLYNELDASMYTLDNKNRIKLIGKDELKRQLGRSPDRADSFVLSLYTYPRPMMSAPSATGQIEMRSFNQSLINLGGWNQ